MGASLPQAGHFFGTAAVCPQRWQLNRAMCRWNVSATLQFGQFRASPQLLQSSEVEKPRRFKNRIVCNCGEARNRSEEHTSELQSLTNLVCRLLLEKKKQKVTTSNSAQTAT